MFKRKSWIFPSEYSSTDSKYTEIQQVVFHRILLTFSVAIGTKYTNAIKLIQLFPRIASQSLSDRVPEHQINKLIVRPNERLTE